MSLRINSEAPNFTANTTQGAIDFHTWIGDSWAILFSHPKDFTPVCTTELGYMAGLQPEVAKRDTKIIGLSVDPVENLSKWARDIEETQGHAINYPIPRTYRGTSAMTRDIPARDPAGRRNAWMTASIDLQTPHLHDFSDLDWGGVRPIRLLGWTMAIVAVMTVAHLIQHPDAREAKAASVVAVAVAPPG